MSESLIESIRERMRNGDTTARRMVDEAFENIDAIKDYHAVLSVTRERAYERADAIDAAIARGEDAGRLAGVPFIAKDNFLTSGGPTTAASHILERFESPLQATAIEKLEAEGAILVAKANLDAFAHGGSTENSAFGPTHNAVDTSRVAGGSSGGSAVAVALAAVPFALGTDTGGSIRQPASFNGVVGVKPTYGTVSRFGVVAMASSTDTIGPITRNVGDAELVLDVLAGRDARDGTTLPDFFEPEATVAPMKVGLIKEFMDEGVDPEVRAAIRAYADSLTKAGHEVREVSLRMLKYSLAIYYIVVPAEISSNLARYDGIRYGARATAASLAELYGKSRDEGFETENKRRILIGSYVLSSGFFDAYYQQAQKARTLLIADFTRAFDEFDGLLGPVAPTPAFALGENATDPVKMYLADVMSVPASLAGLPAISVPAGTNEAGLPIGAQLIGPRRSDARLLALARSIEDGSDG